MDLFNQLDVACSDSLQKEDLAGARQACNEMATQIHSVPGQKLRYEASKKLNLARERVTDLANRAMLTDGDQSTGLSNGLNGPNSKQMNRQEREILM